MSLSWELKVGDRVRITNSRSVYYGQIGTVTEFGNTGGLYVRHADGQVSYHPWGYDKV